MIGINGEYWMVTELGCCKNRIFFIKCIIVFIFVFVERFYFRIKDPSLRENLRDEITHYSTHPVGNPANVMLTAM